MRWRVPGGLGMQFPVIPTQPVNTVDPLSPHVTGINGLIGTELSGGGALSGLTNNPVILILIVVALFVVFGRH